jgi:hypothetical protein
MCICHSHALPVVWIRAISIVLFMHMQEVKYVDLCIHSFNFLKNSSLDCYLLYILSQLRPIFFLLELDFIFLYWQWQSCKRYDACVKPDLVKLPYSYTCSLRLIYGINYHSYTRSFFLELHFTFLYWQSCKWCDQDSKGDIDMLYTFKLPVPPK